ncbi:MAG: helix-hairpin-helix domain-containing protein [Undibacterium sp.]|nr:helix-hairpin-helix domain-containing protein [Undibacterium sp.]
MNPEKVNRQRLEKLTDLPNIGPASAKDLVLLGYSSPHQLVAADPLQMYRDLCNKTGVRHDPCVLDVFISITRFMDGEAPKSWWQFTEERKKILSSEES